MFGLHTELSCGFFYFWNLLIFLQNFQKPQKVIFLRRPMWPLVFDREDLSGLRNYFFQDHLGIYPQILPLSSISMHFHAFPCISMHFHAFPITFNNNFQPLLTFSNHFKTITFNHFQTTFQPFSGHFLPFETTFNHFQTSVNHSQTTFMHFQPLSNHFRPFSTHYQTTFNHFNHFQPL